jgi:hypothetical protein
MKSFDVYGLLARLTGNTTMWILFILFVVFFVKSCIDFTGLHIALTALSIVSLMLSYFLNIFFSLCSEKNHY